MWFRRVVRLKNGIQLVVRYSEAIIFHMARHPWLGGVPFDDDTNFAISVRRSANSVDRVANEVNQHLVYFGAVAKDRGRRLWKNGFELDTNTASFSISS
jgi:hypothetical protein